MLSRFVTEVVCGEEAQCREISGKLTNQIVLPKITWRHKDVATRPPLEGLMKRGLGTRLSQAFEA